MKRSQKTELAGAYADARALGAAAAGSQHAMVASNGVLESSADIVPRRAQLQASNLTGELVAELEQFLAACLTAMKPQDRSCWHWTWWTPGDWYIGFSPAISG